MRDAISHLKLKLAQAEEESSCAAVNRLRAKLRELMKDGQKADQQVPMVVERSMQTLADVSKSYEDLRVENERLQTELTQIRRSMEEVAASLLEGTVARPEDSRIEMSALLTRLQNCEALLAVYRTQLDEKTAYAEALLSELEVQKTSAAALALELDRLTVSYEAAVPDEVIEARKLEEGREEELEEEELEKPEELDDKALKFYYTLFAASRFTLIK